MAHLNWYNSCLADNYNDFYDPQDEDQNSAGFWKRRACEAESRRTWDNYELAHEILQQGLEFGATPAEDLESALEDISMRWRSTLKYNLRERLFLEDGEIHVPCSRLQGTPSEKCHNADLGVTTSSCGSDTLVSSSNQVNMELTGSGFPRSSAAAYDSESTNATSISMSPTLTEEVDQKASTNFVEPICLKAYLGPENECKTEDEVHARDSVPATCNCQDFAENPFQSLEMGCLSDYLSPTDSLEASGKKIRLLKQPSTGDQNISPSQTGTTDAEEVRLDIAKLPNARDPPHHSVATYSSLKNERIGSLTEFVKHPACILGALGMGVAIATSSVLSLCTKEQ